MSERRHRADNRVDSAGDLLASLADSGVEESSCRDVPLSHGGPDSTVSFQLASPTVAPRRGCETPAVCNPRGRGASTGTSRGKWPS